MAQKKIPARQCIGCLTSRPKKDPACLAKAKKKKALERCFEQPVPAEVYDALAAQLADVEKEAQPNGEA